MSFSLIVSLLVLFLLNIQISSATVVQVDATGDIVEDPSSNTQSVTSRSSRTTTKLQKKPLVRAHEILSTSLAADCPASSTFHVHLLVTHHLHFLILPTHENESVDAGCNPFLIHTLTDADSGDPNKKHAISLPYGLKSLYDTAGIDYDDIVEKDETVDFGRYKLDEIISAYNLATVDAPERDGMPFNYVFNNCGDFLASFLSHLGHVSNPTETARIAQLLLKNAEDLLPDFREAAAASGSDELSNLSDAELVYWMVETRLSGMYEKQHEQITDDGSGEDMQQQQTTSTN